MKCLCILLTSVTIALAIQVPSSWHEEEDNSRYKNVQTRRIIKTTNKPQLFNSPVQVHGKPKLKHGKPSWENLPKSKRKINSKTQKKSYELKDPTVSISNYVQVPSPSTKKLSSRSKIPPTIHSHQIFPKLTQINAPVDPFLSRSHKFSTVDKLKQETPKQNRLVDFISGPLDFREFTPSSTKSPQQEGVPPGSSSNLVPYQNIGAVFGMPPNHKLPEQKKPFQNFDQTFNIPFNHEFVSTNNQNDPKNHLFKNYRDDRTHEPIAFDPFLDEEPSPIIERSESEKAPVSSHEYPGDIPTKPIYPGEGLWAKKGLKHRPFISKQKFESLEKDEHVPDGYDIFEESEKTFNQQQKQFNENANGLPKKQSADPIGTQEIPEETNVGKAGEDAEEEFVPMKLYAQVRHSEDIHHLPNHEDENGRLREAIKESKIQTVYTEEGYEDNAYDHEGHEKEAENKEEFEELDRGQEKTEEKKVPNKKYNLHLVPRVESTRYSSGLKLPTDEEIENHKKKQLEIPEDTDIAGSEFAEPVSSEEDVPVMKKSNNFISTKEVKTMTTMEKDDGDTETEISSKIKVVMQPNNTARSHEFVKINPKVYKNWKKVSSTPRDDLEVVPTHTSKVTEPEPNGHGIYIEEVISSSTEQLITAEPTTEVPEFMSGEIPTTTFPTTAMPSHNRINSDLSETSKNINEAFSKIELKTRRKRFVNDFPDIKVNNGFISKIKHDLGEPAEDQRKAKFPYYSTYKQIDLNENSPLRYSEDLKNVPVKTNVKMAFYEQADSRIECPEIESTVEPIPDRVQNKGEDQESDEEYDDDSEEIKETKKLAEQPKGPRLNMLGDKIDCLKARYFGENPLDNPFFEEDTVGPVQPIFRKSEDSKTQIKNSSDIDNISAGTQNPSSSYNFIDNEIIDDINESTQVRENFPELGVKNTTDRDTFNPSFPTSSTLEISDVPIEFDEEKLGVNVLNDISRNLNSPNHSEAINQSQVPHVHKSTPTMSLLTTPGYTIDLKPKHIYDQIHLLNYLPEELNITSNDSDTVVKDSVADIEVETMNDNEKGVDEGDARQQKSYEAEEEDKLTYDSSMIQALPEAEALKKRRRFRLRRKRPGFQIFDINRFIPKPYTIRKEYAPSFNSGDSKRFQIFDVNKFLPTTSYPLVENPITSSTVLPKHKVVSEVFYKDNIKPNEQLNVFTDVLNNIRNSSAEIETDSSQEPSHISIASNHLKDNGNIDLYSNEQEFDNHYYPPTVTTMATPIHTSKSNRGHIRFTVDTLGTQSATTDRPIQSSNEKLKQYLAFLQAKMRQTGALQTEPTEEASTKEPEYVENVQGMYPPVTQHYKTIFNPKRDNTGHLAIPGYVGMNKYLVMGMKPPPRQKVSIYSDFLFNNQLRKKSGLLRRGKRSTNRAAYAEVSRKTARPSGEDKSAGKDDEDDDYVPHRPKNYYYDEKTGKIIYNRSHEPMKSEEEEEEIEYIEITEAPRPKTTSKPKQNPIFATAKPPPQGQSYVDFVKKLRSSANYTFIPDPTTTEKNTEPSTQKVTTVSSLSTSPPEFLSILNKVRNTSNYKIIEDPTEKKSTTTEAPEEALDEEEEDEPVPTNIRNSPGGEQHIVRNNLQIFDISDYIPKLKNYLPRTSIDYSKYKTIERPVTKNNQEEMDDDAEDSSSSPETAHNDESHKEEKASAAVPTTTTTTTAPKTTPSSRRRRPTTLRSTKTTTTPIPVAPSTQATAESQEVRNEKPKRNFRRRPTRIKSTTTERFLDEDVDDTTKAVRRRKIDENKDSKSTTDERDATTSDKSLNPSSIRPGKRVEVFQKFNRYSKHGGNYRKEDTDIEQGQKAAEPISEEPRRGKDVEIIKQFDKTKRHGGNYKSEDANDDESKATDDIPSPTEHEEPQGIDGSDSEPEDQPFIVELLPKYEEDEKTSDRDEGEDERLNQKRKRIIVKNKSPERMKPTGRLTDIVPKPESFFSDPNLPQTVNLLVLAQPLSNEEDDENGGVEDDASIENIEVAEGESTTSTKKPNFIKDPSERLYYYAPV